MHDLQSAKFQKLQINKFDSLILNNILDMQLACYA